MIEMAGVGVRAGIVTMTVTMMTASTEPYGIPFTPCTGPLSHPVVVREGSTIFFSFFSLHPS